MSKTTFKTVDKKIIISYIVIDGIEVSINSIISDLEELLSLGCEGYFSINEKVKKILDNRKLLSYNIRGSFWANDKKKLRKLLNKIYKTYDKMYKEKNKNEIEKFIKKWENKGYTQKLPTRIGIYNYVRFPEWEDPIELMIYKKYKKLYGKRTIHTDVMSYKLKRIENELWKKLEI